MLVVSPLSSPLARLSAGDRPVLRLGEEWSTLEFDLPAAGTAHLRLVNASDCRRSVQFEVRGPGISACLDAMVMAAWESALLPMAVLRPGRVSLEIRVVDRPSGLIHSINPETPLPSLTLFSPQMPGAGTALLLERDAPQLEAPERARRFLQTPGAWDDLGWMTGCTCLGLETLGEAAVTVRLTGPGAGLPLLPLQTSSETVDVETAVEHFAPVAALAHLMRGQDNADRVLRAFVPELTRVCQQELPELTTEGCFTLAYPLAAIANTLGDAHLGEVAVRATERRWDTLVRGDTVWQRAQVKGREAWMPNWARGTAWLTLGTVLSARELPAHRQRLLRALPQLFDRLLGEQTAQGEWRVFTHRSGTRTEASGSAGIATAMALAAQMTEFSPALREDLSQAARRCARALAQHVDVEGALGNVSQHNPAREEALQLTHRIRAGWATGLYVALLGSLN